MYIRELPHIEKSQVCDILTTNDCFWALGKHMQFEESQLQRMQKAPSPMEKLLEEWDFYGHMVSELFILLYRMKQHEAMAILKPFVEPKFHSLIKKTYVDSRKILNGPADISNENNISETLAAKLDISDSVVEFAGSIPQIPYEDLRAATNGWDPSKILGKGGFGMVFRGIWKHTEVAIKRIEKREDSPDSTQQQIIQSKTELQYLNAYRHDNILPLYGYSVGGPQPCLVYQYMSGGSLQHRLHPRDPALLLSWPTRLKISVGTARGLQFLHTIRKKPLVHGDVKPANILLDANDIPRIGDFGLAREGPASEYIRVTRVQGTLPYLPEEFVRSRKFSPKVDTYSFGVVLFELATGASVYSDKRERKNLRNHVLKWDEAKLRELKDKRVEGGEECFDGLIRIGKACVCDDRGERPEMVQVLQMLEKL